ncbi:HK97 gp10 family phage protein [Chromobacterium haemolyticum]|uniref:HK97 gp10 family phage protein n=1 Tax=Chromobacterium haemolyticum TaxID=394935 RepID=UPI004055DC76
MIRHEIVGDKQTIEFLRQFHPQVQRNVEATIGRLTLKLLAKVKAEKLSGQVLNVQTGRLRRSINRRIAGAGTTSIAGFVGTNVEYGRRWELGFDGTETVREHLRLVKQAWGKPIAPRMATVKAHTRKVELPARSFLRSALTEMEGEIVSALSEATRKGIQRR